MRFCRAFLVMSVAFLAMPSLVSAQVSIDQTTVCSSLKGVAESALQLRVGISGGGLTTAHRSDDLTVEILNVTGRTVQGHLTVEAIDADGVHRFKLPVVLRPGAQKSILLSPDRLGLNATVDSVRLRVSVREYGLRMATKIETERFTAEWVDEDYWRVFSSDFVTRRSGSTLTLADGTTHELRYRSEEMVGLPVPDAVGGE